MFPTNKFETLNVPSFAFKITGFSFFYVNSRLFSDLEE